MPFGCLYAGRIGGVIRDRPRSSNRRMTALMAPASRAAGVRHGWRRAGAECYDRALPAPTNACELRRAPRRRSRGFSCSDQAARERLVRGRLSVLVLAVGLAFFTRARPNALAIAG